MLLGEYTATTAIHNAIPSLMAKPHTWGKLSTGDDYFILFDYRNINQTLPDPDKFTSRLAELHRTATSENGMFGFPVTTCDGAVPHIVAWQKSWALFFADMLRGVLKFDTDTNGHWAELDDVFDRTISHVIPRLLGVLQSEGRELRPSLIHGDMGEGNVGTDLDTGEIIFVDASSYYAHNEMELGLWRWSETMGRFTESYLRHFPPSEPVEEWDDRNRLYSLKTKLNMSADHPGEDGRRIRRL
jgi:protein-ribulosamine 3-kinase